MAEPAPIFDVVIAGGGASGLALAAAIKQAMGQGASVAVVDPGAPAAASASPLRTVAIADGPRRLLEHIGAWAAIEPKAQPILSMAIMDGDVRDAVRLPHLNFAAKDQRRSPIWPSTTMSSARSPRSAIGSGFSASRGPLRIGLSGKHVGGAWAIRRPRVARAPRGRRRRRALETQPARRHPDHRLGL